MNVSQIGFLVSVLHRRFFWLLLLWGPVQFGWEAGRAEELELAAVVDEGP